MRGEDLAAGAIAGGAIARAREGRRFRGRRAVFCVGADDLFVQNIRVAQADGDELNVHGTDPLDADSDDDGLTDSEEITLGLEPGDWETGVDLIAAGKAIMPMPSRMKVPPMVPITRYWMDEVSALIGALPYERTPGRRDYRNGHYTRDLETTVGLIEDLSVPRTRNGHKTQVFEKYKRRRAELDEVISEMFIGGVSTRKAGEVVESLTGSKPSPSTVSRVPHAGRRVRGLEGATTRRAL